MRRNLDKGYSSWNSMKLSKAIVVSDIAELARRIEPGLSFKITTDVHTRERIVKYTNWATVIESYPYHCLVEMYFFNGLSTVMLKRDIKYVDLLVALKTKTIPYVEAFDRLLESEVLRV